MKRHNRRRTGGWLLGVIVACIPYFGTAETFYNSSSMFLAEVTDAYQNGQFRLTESEDVFEFSDLMVNETFDPAIIVGRSMSCFLSTSKNETTGTFDDPTTVRCFINEHEYEDDKITEFSRIDMTEFLVELNMASKCARFPGLSNAVPSCN